MSAFSYSNVLPSSLRRRSSTPSDNDRNNEAKRGTSFDEVVKHHQVLSKQLGPLKENVLSTVVSNNR